MNEFDFETKFGAVRRMESVDTESGHGFKSESDITERRLSNL